MSDESINPLATSNSLVTYFNYIGTKTRVKFEYQCLRQDEITLTDKKTVNIYTVYETNLWDRGCDDYPVLENSLFGAVKLVKNADIDKYKYSGYDTGFDRHGSFSVASGFGKNVIIFGVNMSSLYTMITRKKIF